MIVLVAVATVIWVPIGVWIGMNPKVTRFAQPIVQVLASFPANFLFPFATSCSWPGTSRLNFGAILLMALGAQWYILFNVIAGASAIPSDLREAMTNLGVRGWLRWKNFILPAIFPAYVTGGITAAGGAWNASIVAEIVSYGHHHLTATGLGAYIAQATATGNFPKILVGHRGDERLRGRHQPAVLAPAVRPRRTEVLAVTRPSPHRSRVSGRDADRRGDHRPSR